VTEVIVVARLAAMGGFIMLGRITDWTCDRSDRHRAARRDVRFYHVGVPQLKKKVYFYYSYYSVFKKKILSLK
jgi:hypothetical protein